VNKVFVTGIGAVTASGIGASYFCNDVFNGKSLISDISFLNAEVKIGSYVKDEPINKALIAYDFNIKDVRRYDKFIKLGLLATHEAVIDSKLDFSNIDSSKISVIVSSGIGGSSTLQSSILEMNAEKRISPFTIPYSLINILPGIISIKYNIHGLNYSIVSACATSAHSIGEAYHMIKSGRADVVICGGAEAALNKIGINGFNAMNALSTNFQENPTIASRPLDQNRDGFVIGEGSGILILESENSAKKRNAKIYCQISGYGASSDASHITSPDKEGKYAAISINQALKEANLNFEQLNYINLHGTSTPTGDIAEIKALKLSSGNDKIFNIPISSTKSMTGHSLGAVSALEAIICINAIEKQILPPQINLFNKDSEINDINIITEINKKANIVHCLSNSFGFGGTNASLIFSKPF
jgi:3-oxoacyl-[acyl-carrier-protein] synthase II